MASSSVDASSMPAIWVRSSVKSLFSVARRSDATDTSFNSKIGSDGFTKSARNVLVITTVIGGTFVLSLLIWALYRRNNGGRSRRRRGHRRDSTITDPTLSPRLANVTALPIYRETGYTVSLEKNGSFMNLSRVFKSKVQTTPGPRRLEPQRPDMVQSAGTNLALSPRTPTAPVSQDPTFLSVSDATPAKSPGDDTPAGTGIVRTIIRRPSSAALPPSFHVEDNATNARDSIDSTGPGDVSPETKHEDKRDSQVSHEDDADLELPPTTPASSIFPSNPQDRWSWTNSQAPPTPRMAPGNRRASLLSMSNNILPPVPSMPRPPYQRNELDKRRPVSEWIRGQPESIDEEAQVRKQTQGAPGSGLLRKLSTKGPANGLSRNNSVLGVFRRPSQK